MRCLKFGLLGREDPALFFPHAAYATVKSWNRLSLIARPLNLCSQNLNVVIAALPRSWGLTSRVYERVLYTTFVQFLFQSERWEINLAFEFLSNIDLWVQMRGIPLLYICEETVVEIAQGLGEIISLDFHDDTATQIAYIRTTLISFQYERLRRICSSCFRLTHHRNFCLIVSLNLCLFFVVIPTILQGIEKKICVHNPPRVAAPSLNHEELVAAYFPHARAASLPNNAVMDHQTSSSRQLVSRNSNIQLFSGNVIASNAPRLVEIGESSRKVEIGEFVNMMEKGDSTKRKNMGGVRDKEDERKHRGFEHKDGVILKPPKKR
ncbi:hypothetical protein AtNW77_Chr1g0040601 [Arabidopsis thaliana]